MLAQPLAAQTPPELESVRFSGPELTPCPACICAAPTGEVFVGVDMLGSLGKGPGKALDLIGRELGIESGEKKAEG